jgi:hypothetical protein
MKSEYENSAAWRIPVSQPLRAGLFGRDPSQRQLQLPGRAKPDISQPERQKGLSQIKEVYAISIDKKR